MNQLESLLDDFGCGGQLGSYLPCELPGEQNLEVEALEPQRQRVVPTHPRALGGPSVTIVTARWDLVGFSAWIQRVWLLEMTCGASSLVADGSVTYHEVQWRSNRRR